MMVRTLSFMTSLALAAALNFAGPTCAAPQGGGGGGGSAPAGTGGGGGSHSGGGSGGSHSGGGGGGFHADGRGGRAGGIAFGSGDRSSGGRPLARGVAFALAAHASASKPTDGHHHQRQYASLAPHDRGDETAPFETCPPFDVQSFAGHVYCGAPNKATGVRLR
jgi:hypothetical protein